MPFPRKIMEQCRLCPAKLWSNADFAPQNHTAFVLCPAKSQRLCSLPREIMEQCRLCSAKSRTLRSLPREIMEQCRLCSAKSRRHSFRGQQISSNLNLFTFFFVCCKSLLFQRPLQPFGPLFKENIFCVTVPLINFQLVAHLFLPLPESPRVCEVWCWQELGGSGGCGRVPGESKFLKATT